MQSPAPAQTTSISKTELPAWVDAAGKANYDKAVALDDAPLDQYAGPRVAAQPDSLKSAFSFFNQNANAGVADTAAGGDLFKSTDVSSYLNPYIDNVENKALDSLDRSRQMALGSNADKASAASAFGGSRSAIIDAVTNSETAREAGILSAGLRKEGFDTAVNNKNSAAAGLLATGSQKQKQMLDQFAGMSSIGALDQAQSQAEINAAMGKHAEVAGKEEADLNRRLAALGMTPYSSSTTNNTTGTAENRGTDWAAMGGGILSLFAGLSEDDEKTDIKKLGKIGNSPLNMYAFRYKGDPKNYPKVVGAMASEVEKHYPDRVAKVGGKRVIDYSLFKDIEAA